MAIIDLRSDTVTRPTQAMREAMLQAPVGDDVFNEDPTVNELETYAAQLFGKEAGLFCPSGTMTNQIAIKVHTKPGDEVICETNSHIYNYEGGGISFNSGAQAKLLLGNEGKLTAVQIENAINADLDWLTETKLVSLENTNNRAGGSFYTLKEVEPISALCRAKKLKLHLDGARLFNALAETNEKPKEWGQLFDSVSICLSKGLGAPVGSLLLGDNEFIKKGRRVRKVLGGGMRQAGILAAAGKFALQNNVSRLHEDHAKAKRIEQVLRTLPYVESLLPVYTNILIFNVKADLISGDALEKKLAAKNIRISAFGKQTIRMVTHLDVLDEMVENVCAALREVKM